MRYRTWARLLGLKTTLCFDIKHVFQFGLWSETSDKLLYPNPASEVFGDTSVFVFMGQLVGKALHAGVLLEPEFAHFFLNKLLGRPNYVDDLVSLDAEVHTHLTSLKTFTGDFEDMCLYFEVRRGVRSFVGRTTGVRGCDALTCTCACAPSHPHQAIEDRYGDARTVELMPGGSDVAVTKANVAQYIVRMAHYLLNVRTASQTVAFLRGFNHVIPPAWMHMFSQVRMLQAPSCTGIACQAADGCAVSKLLLFTRW